LVKFTAHCTELFLKTPGLSEKVFDFRVSGEHKLTAAVMPHFTLEEKLHRTAGNFAYSNIKASCFYFRNTHFARMYLKS